MNIPISQLAEMVRRLPRLGRDPIWGPYSEYKEGDQYQVPFWDRTVPGPFRVSRFSDLKVEVRTVTFVAVRTPDSLEWALTL